MYDEYFYVYFWLILLYIIYCICRYVLCDIFCMFVSVYCEWVVNMWYLVYLFWIIFCVEGEREKKCNMIV